MEHKYLFRLNSCWMFYVLSSLLMHPFSARFICLFPSMQISRINVYTGWEKIRYTAINYKLYTYFWAPLYDDGNDYLF